MKPLKQYARIYRWLESYLRYHYICIWLAERRDRTFAGLAIGVKIIVLFPSSLNREREAFSIMHVLVSKESWFFIF